MTLTLTLTLIHGLLCRPPTHPQPEKKNKVEIKKEKKRKELEGCVGGGVQGVGTGGGGGGSYIQLRSTLVKFMHSFFFLLQHIFCIILNDMKTM